MAAKDKNVQPMVVSPIEVSPRLVEPKAIKYPFGGTPPTPPPSPIDEWWGLKLTMPEGGTVILHKYRTPNAVSLEVSTDAVNWSTWELVGSDYKYTLQAGETLCIRNMSTTFVSPSTGSNKYWQFIFDAATYASGDITSISVNERSNNTLADYCYYNMFYGCTSLVTAPELPAQTLANYCYGSMFYGCTHLSEIHTRMNNISATGCITSWVNGVAAAGDFYCPALLTIPTGESGIPNGWTRHDI